MKDIIHIEAYGHSGFVKIPGYIIKSKGKMCSKPCRAPTQKTYFKFILNGKVYARHVNRYHNLWYFNKKCIKDLYDLI